MKTLKDLMIRCCSEEDYEYAKLCVKEWLTEKRQEKLNRILHRPAEIDVLDELLEELKE